MTVRCITLPIVLQRSNWQFCPPQSDRAPTSPRCNSSLGGAIWGNIPSPGHMLTRGSLDIIKLIIARQLAKKATERCHWSFPVTGSAFGALPLFCKAGINRGT